MQLSEADVLNHPESTRPEEITLHDQVLGQDNLCTRCGRQSSSCHSFGRSSLLDGAPLVLGQTP
jgi:hypothetical protein